MAFLGPRRGASYNGVLSFLNKIQCFPSYFGYLHKNQIPTGHILVDILKLGADLKGFNNGISTLLALRHVVRLEKPRVQMIWLSL